MLCKSRESKLVEEISDSRLKGFTDSLGQGGLRVWEKGGGVETEYCIKRRYPFWQVFFEAPVTAVF